MAYSQRAFTLIELLIVVAIIAILAAIAVPNFLEAQVRSKVSRGKNDMRSIANALESYRVDCNQYPMDIIFYNFPPNASWPGSGGGEARHTVTKLNLLTTPVAYMTSIPRNVFANKGNRGVFYGMDYGYLSWAWKEVIMVANPTWPQTDKVWVLCSYGPDQRESYGVNLLWGEDYVNRTNNLGENPPFYGALYDPTNGTISNGDIVRVGP